MFRNDKSDIYGRFCNARQPGQSRYINDIYIPPVQQAIPKIGGSLPPRPAPQAVTPKTMPAAVTAAPTLRQQPQQTTRMPVNPSQLSSVQPQRLQPQAPVRKRRRHPVRTVILMLLALIILGGAWMGTKIVHNTLQVFKGNIFSILTITKLNGEASGRVNILLAGNSADDPGHDGANLTDSIMLVSIDVQNNSAFMLSIPRDLWVDIPGYNHAKINEAYVDGQTGNFSSPGYPNGGMGLLENVVRENLGVPINYYALINYSALKDAVNAVGGVDINIQSSDPRGLYDPSIDWSTHGPLVKLSNGVHHLNGEQALDLSRARGDAYGSYGFPMADFDRTQHQRELMVAVKDKALTAGVLTNPVAISNLFDAIGKNVHTDLTLGDVRRLYDLSKTINNSQIQSISLNNANGVNLLANYSAPNGESALIPAAGVDDFSRIKQYVAQLTSNDPVVRENAQVVILNGTSTGGLAANAKQALLAKNITVAAIGDATVPATTSLIIDASGGKMPATLKLLEKMYGSNVTNVNPYSKIYNADFIVVLGADHVQVSMNTP